VEHLRVPARGVVLVEAARIGAAATAASTALLMAGPRPRFAPLRRARRAAPARANLHAIAAAGDASTDDRNVGLGAALEPWKAHLFEPRRSCPARAARRVSGAACVAFDHWRPDCFPSIRV